MSSKKIQDTLLSVRPTLYIGLGGAGKAVLLELRKKFLSNIWGREDTKVKLNNFSEFPLAQFFYYDLEAEVETDNNCTLVKASQLNPIELTQDEKVTGCFDWHEYIQDENALDKYPHIKEWFPISPKKWREIGLDVNKSKAQLRAVSKFNFFDQFATIKDKIRRKLFNLKIDIAQEQSLNRMGLTTDLSRPRIVVIASSAGVTGSGAFIDMGYLARFLAQQEGLQVGVELMLFMPTAYAVVNQNGTQANAYAALMELEAAMRGNNAFAGRWNNSDCPVLGSMPYSEVYLLDNSNLAKQHLRNIENVYQMLATNLVEDFSSGDFALRKSSIAVNQAQYKTTLYEPLVQDKKFSNGCFSYAKSYSSFGDSVIELKPAAFDKQLNDLAVEMLKAYFLNTAEFKNMLNDVTQLLVALESKNVNLPANLQTNLGTTVYIETPELAIPTFNSSQLLQWADQALKELGNSQQIAEILGFPQSRSQIVAQVLKVAEGQLLALASLVNEPIETISSATNTTLTDPLTIALEKMTATSRAELFRKWLALAMPWVDVNLTPYFSLQPGQLKCLIAVTNPQEFKAKFGDELNACLPKSTGMTSEQLLIVATSSSTRAVCYTEISGLPLTVLSGIEGWQRSYHKESENGPLHTHLDVTQFSHPIAPSTQEVARLAKDFKYFLLAVMTQIVTRYEPKVVPSGQYLFTIAKAETRRIGNERSIRQNGLSKYYREAIIGRVNDFLEQADAYCLLTLSALATYYESQVYTPKLLLNEDGNEMFVKGFASIIAKELSFELCNRAKQKGLLESEIHNITQQLLEPKNLKLWAKPIPDSDTDAYKWEVRETDFGDQARLKMTVLKELLVQGQMLPIIQSTMNIAVLGASDLIQFSTIPPLIMQNQYYLGITGQQYGPFNATQIIQMFEIGQFSTSCKVWRQGLDTWCDLFEFPELANYLGAATKTSIQPPPLE